MKQFDTLTKSEIKKINKAGNGKIGEYYAEPSTIDGFYNVEASVFDDTFEEIIAKVNMMVCLFDRRKSFITTVNGNWVA